MDCEAYLGTNIFAKRLVEKTIKKAVSILSGRQNESFCEEELVAEEQKLYKNITWPSIDEFDVMMGFKKLDEFINTQTLCCKDLLYCINFMDMQMAAANNYYIYEVKWSMPSNSYPIPQATANMYFSFEVSRIKPGQCPVQVKYMYEGSQLIHQPQEIKFNEQWLLRILENKLKLYMGIQF